MNPFRIRETHVNAIRELRLIGVGQTPILINKLSSEVALSPPVLLFLGHYEHLPYRIYPFLKSIDMHEYIYFELSQFFISDSDYMQMVRTQLAKYFAMLP